MTLLFTVQSSYHMEHCLKPQTLRQLPLILKSTLSKADKCIFMTLGDFKQVKGLFNQTLRLLTEALKSKWTLGYAVMPWSALQ